MTTLLSIVPTVFIVLVAFFVGRHISRLRKEIKHLKNRREWYDDYGY